jgi:hypothetical protein
VATSWNIHSTLQRSVLSFRRTSSINVRSSTTSRCASKIAVFRADGFSNPLLHFNSAGSAMGFFLRLNGHQLYIQFAQQNAFRRRHTRPRPRLFALWYPALRPRAQTSTGCFFRWSPMFSSDSRCACAACGGFGFARNTAATLDVFYWLQVTNFGLLKSAPNGVNYIDVRRLFLHGRCRV